jgi:hypothetical protein
VFFVCEGTRSNKFGRATQELPKLLVNTHWANRPRLTVLEETTPEGGGPARFGGLARGWGTRLQLDGARETPQAATVCQPHPRLQRGAIPV